MVKKNSLVSAANRMYDSARKIIAINRRMPEGELSSQFRRKTAVIPKAKARNESNEHMKLMKSLSYKKKLRTHTRTVDTAPKILNPLDTSLYNRMKANVRLKENERFIRKREVGKDDIRGV